MRGHAHDCARTVIGQHKVAQPQRHALPGKGMQGICAGKDAFFLQRIRLPVNAVHIADTFHKGAHFVSFFITFNELFHHGMLWRKGHERNAKERVGARGEHVYARNALGQQGCVFNTKGNGGTC